MSDSPAGPGSGQDQDQLRRVAADLRAAYAGKQDAEARLHEAELWSVRVLLRAVHARCPRLAGHLRRVGNYASEIGRALGLEGYEVEQVGAAGCLHDVGLLEAPTSAAHDFPDLHTACQGLREHCERGHSMLHGSGLDLIASVEAVVLAHHERWDGSGFPGGLCGTEIPVDARIVGLADAYDALRETHRQPAPLSHAEAERALREGGAGVDPGAFDPEVLAAFFRVGARLDRMGELMRDGRL